jgi:hypothetical protein
MTGRHEGYPVASQVKEDAWLGDPYIGTHRADDTYSLVPTMIIGYVWCETCRCSVHEWAVYRRHADQGCVLVWGGASDDRPA